MRTRGSVEILQLLKKAADGAILDGVVREELDPLAANDLAREAGNNVNWMLLDRFFEENGLRRRYHVHRAARLRCRDFTVAVIVFEYADEPDRGQIVFAECGARRLSVALVGEDAAFVRGAYVSALPLGSIDDSILRGTSLDIQVPPVRRLGRGPGFSFPPAA